MSTSTFVLYDDHGSEEIVIVESDGIQVLAGTDDGRVFADHVRIYDRRENKELAYWEMNEWKEEDDSADPSTAMNAILSAIEIVASGRYRETIHL